MATDNQKPTSKKQEIDLNDPAMEPYLAKDEKREFYINNDKTDFELVDGEYRSSMIIKFQRYLLALKELNKDKNEKYYGRFVKALVDKRGITLENATAEALGNVDIELFNENLDILTAIAPNIVLDSNLEIKNNYDAWAIMKDAGYDFTTELGEIPQGFIEDVQVMAAYDSHFPDKNREPLVNRLRDAKDSILSLLKSAKNTTGKVLKNDKVQLGMSTVAIGVACAAGSAALPLALAAYTGKLMENPSVQKLANNLHKKVSSSLVKLGFKKEMVDERTELLGNKFKRIMSNKWAKRATIGLAASMLGFGVFNIASAIHTGLTSAPDFVSNLKDGMSNVHGIDMNAVSTDVAFEPVKNVHSGLFEHAKTAFDKLPNGNVHGAAQSIVDDAIKCKDLHLSDIHHAATHAATATDIHHTATHAATATDIHHTATHAATATDVHQATSAAHHALNATDIIVQKGDSAWDLASQHYQHLTGNIPTDQQVTQMVDSLHLENPNAIHVGQTLHFTNDIANFHSYSGTVDFSMTTTNSSDMQGFYDAIVHEAYPNGTPELFNKAAFLDSVRAANPQLEDCYELGHHVVSVHYPSVPESQYMFHTIPGPAVDMVPHGGEMHHVYHHADNASNVHQSVEHSANAVQALDTTVIVQKGDSAWDLASQHYQELTGNIPTDQQVTQMVDSLHLENPNAVHVGQTLHFTNDISNFHSYSGTVDFSMTTTNSSDVEGFYDAIVHEAYPNGTPEMFNKAAFLDSVRAANPQLEDCYELGHHVVSVHYPSVPESQYAFSKPEGLLDTIVNGTKHAYYATSDFVSDSLDKIAESTTTNNPLTDSIHNEHAVQISKNSASASKKFMDKIFDNNYDYSL